jgi:hypothetical protein
LTINLLVLAFLNIACPGMKMASSSRRRTAVCVTLCESAYRQLLPLVVAQRKSNMKAVLRLNNLLNLEKLKGRAALWELFCGGQRESEMLRGGEASKLSKLIVLLRKYHLPWSEAILHYSNTPVKAFP